MNLVSQFNKLALEVLKPLDNPYISTVVKVFLILYASMIAPELPENLSSLLKNKIVRIVLIFLIAFIAVKDVQIALLSSIGLIVSIMALQKGNVIGDLVSDVAEVVEDTAGAIVGGASDALSGSESSEAPMMEMPEVEPMDSSM